MAGNITIVEARERYVKVPRDLTRGDVSLAAVGLYAAILSLGKDWRLNIHGLSSVLGVSVALVKKYMGELEKSGYVQRTRTKGDDGRFTGWDYTVGTDRLKTPTSEETDGRKNRQSENPTVGKTDDRKIEAYNKDYNQQEELKVKEAYKKPDIKGAGFDFRRSLIDLGVPAALVDDWLKVRHTKRATNTETAFRNIAAEIAKSGRPAEDCVRFVVERSWAGFKAEWLNEEDSRTRRDTRPAPRREESLTEHYARVNREIEQILHGNGRDYDNQ